MTTITRQAWAAALAFLGTFIWRFLSVLLAEHSRPMGRRCNGSRSTYSMVAGVMMLILVFPGGVLGRRSLITVRLCCWCRLNVDDEKIWLAILGAIGTFALAVSFLGG